MIPVCACEIRRFRNQTPMNTGGRVFPAILPPLPRRFAACPCFPALSRVPRSENTTEIHTPATIGKPSASRHHRTPRRHRSPRPASGLSAGKPWRPWRTSERPPAPPEASAPCQRFGSSGDRSTAPAGTPRNRSTVRRLSAIPATVRRHHRTPRRRKRPACQRFDRVPRRRIPASRGDRVPRRQSIRQAVLL